MNVVPARLEELTNRVDRTPSLVIGIGSAITAVWSVWQVLWLIYTAAVLSGVGWSPVSVIFPLVLWGTVGVVAAISAVAFLTRYKRA